MKVSHILLVLVIALVGGALGAYISHTPTVKIETAYDRVTSTGTLRCGYAISPPNLVKDPNTQRLSGFDYDVWQQIGARLNLKIEWAEEAGWGNFIEGLRGGRYDAFCASLFPDPARSKFLSMTIPVVYSILYTYVRATDRRFDRDQELLNQPSVTLPVIDGDVSETAFKTRFPSARLLDLPQSSTISDMFLAVTNGKADAMFLDQPMFTALDVNNHGVLRRLPNAPPALVFANYYGFNIGASALRDSVNIALQGMIDDGALARIAHTYFKDDVVVPQSQVFKK